MRARALQRLRRSCNYRRTLLAGSVCHTAYDYSARFICSPILSKRGNGLRAASRCKLPMLSCACHVATNKTCIACFVSSSAQPRLFDKLNYRISRLNPTWQCVLLGRGNQCRSSDLHFNSPDALSLYLTETRSQLWL